MSALRCELLSIRERPALLDRAAAWFHGKWGVPLDAYRESMEQSLSGGDPVPQWYLAVEDGAILGGLGVIDNDFHNRKDLAPNVCAVYVEEAYRRRGIAGALLNHACAGMAQLGVDTLYLLTGHTSFYGPRLGVPVHGPGGRGGSAVPDVCPQMGYVKDVEAPKLPIWV